MLNEVLELYKKASIISEEAENECDDAEMMDKSHLSYNTSVSAGNALSEALVLSSNSLGNSKIGAGNLSFPIFNHII